MKQAKSREKSKNSKKAKVDELQAKEGGGKVKESDEPSDKAELRELREEKKAREKEERAKQQAAGGGGGAKLGKTKTPCWSTVAQHLDLKKPAGGKFAPCTRAAGVCFHNHDVLLKAVLQKAFPNNKAAYWQIPAHKAVMDAGIAAMK